MVYVNAHTGNANSMLGFEVDIPLPLGGLGAVP